MRNKKASKVSLNLNGPKMYECSLCGEIDRSTFRQAREGKLVAICEKCQKKKGVCDRCGEWHQRLIRIWDSVEQREKLECLSCLGQLLTSRS